MLTSVEKILTDCNKTLKHCWHFYWNPGYRKHTYSCIIEKQL